MLDALCRAHLSDHSIFSRVGLLVSYLDYTGEHYESDTAAIAHGQPPVDG